MASLLAIETFILGVVLTGIVVVLLILEKWQLNRYLQKLPLRVLVAGTRGKSTITRLIAESLRNSGVEVLAKTTGGTPRLYFADGSQAVLKRRGPARVQEQLRLIRLARRKKCKALCLEGMAVAPELQQLESRIVRPHIYVLSNIRDDHREQLGPTRDEQAQWMCRAIPENCTIVTSESRYLELIRKQAAEKKSRVVFLKPGSTYAETNRRLAEQVCDLAGYKSKLVAQTGTDEDRFIKTNSLTFVDAFDINDIDSLKTFLHEIKTHLAHDKLWNVILNTRADRPERSRQFAQWLAAEPFKIGNLLLCGSHIPYTRRQLLKLKVGAGKIQRLTSSKKIIEVLKQSQPEGQVVIGLGNIAGMGQQIREAIVHAH